RQPDNADVQQLLFRSTWHLADAISEQGRNDQAEKEYQRALNIATKLVHLTNGDLDSRRNVAFIEPKLGDMCKNDDCAVAHYRKAYAINQSLLDGLGEGNAAKKPEIQRDLAANRIRIGDVLVNKPETEDAALKECETAAKTDEQLANQYPDDPVYRSN